MVWLGFEENIQNVPQKTHHSAPASPCHWWHLVVIKRELKKKKQENQTDILCPFFSMPVIQQIHLSCNNEKPAWSRIIGLPPEQPSKTVGLSFTLFIIKISIRWKKQLLWTLYKKHALAFQELAWKFRETLTGEAISRLGTVLRVPVNVQEGNCLKQKK